MNPNLSIGIPAFITGVAFAILVKMIVDKLKDSVQHKKEVIVPCADRNCAQQAVAYWPAMPLQELQPTPYCTRHCQLVAERELRQRGLA